MKLKILTIAIFLIGFSLIVFADTQTTTLSWVIPSSVAHTLGYGGGCSTDAMYFVESNAVLDSDIDGNCSQVVPYDAESAGSTCQSDSAAPITVTNGGNIPIDVNVSITTTLETGVTLKGWLGDDTTYCGTNGIGGWEVTCSVVALDDTTVPTTTTCVQISDTTTHVFDNLRVSDTNHLCLAADFTGMSYGTTTDTLQTEATAN